MKVITRYGAIAVIAVLLAPLFSDNHAFSLQRSCLRAHTVPLETRGMSALPPVVLWAWERPEDLRFLDPNQTGVAFLAGTIQLGPHGMDFRPRMQLLKVSAEVRLVAVVRIETSGAVLNPEIARKVAAKIARAGRMRGIVAVQVDFDATATQRAFYRDLLLELRRQLPPTMPISITALTSWCIGDRWMAGLPIDEAVPMLFRMGVGQAEVKSWMQSGRDFREATCRTSLGVSLDEPWPQLPPARRLYAFSPAPWTKRSLETLTKEFKVWQ
jgi:hypothetical protein